MDQTKSSLDVTTCPGCGEIVNGQTCRGCGLNVETADTVRCYHCNEAILKGDATRQQIESKFGLSYRWVCKGGCQ
jgi:hypothetical protein